MLLTFLLEFGKNLFIAVILFLPFVKLVDMYCSFFYRMGRLEGIRDHIKRNTHSEKFKLAIRELDDQILAYSKYVRPVTYQKLKQMQQNRIYTQQALNFIRKKP